MRVLSVIASFLIISFAHAQGPLRFLTLAEAEDHIVFNLPHYLTNATSLKVIDLEDGITAGANRGKKVQQYDRHGSIFAGSDGFNQLWYIIPSGTVDGKQTFRFLNAGYMNFLTAMGSEGFSESLTGSESNEQRWFLAQDDHNATSNGFYIISAGEMKGSPLANYHSTKDNNARLGLRSFAVGGNGSPNRGDYNFFVTDFELTGAALFTAQAGSLYQLQPKHAATKRLDLQGGNTVQHTPVQIWESDVNNGNLQWMLTSKNIRGFNNGFTITAVSGRASLRRLVTPLNNGIANGTPLVVTNWNAEPLPQHLWLMLPVLRDAGYFVFISYNNAGKCMDVTAMGNSNGTTTQLWTFQNNNNQKWAIKKIR